MYGNEMEISVILFMKEITKKLNPICTVSPTMDYMQSSSVDIKRMVTLTNLKQKSVFISLPKK